MHAQTKALTIFASAAGSAVSPLYHNHIPTGTIAGFNGVNSGFGGNNDIPTGWAFNN